MSTNIDVIVIGAGLVGCMTAKVLRKNGYSVKILDKKHPMSGSKCATGIWKESWINEKIKPKVLSGLDNLFEFSDIKQELFYNVDKETEETMMYVDWKSICNEDFKETDVVKVVNNQVFTTKGSFLPVRKAVVICAGAFTDELLLKSGYPAIGIDKYWGASIKYKGNIDCSRIGTWAPYKQALVHKISETEIKFSDGSTVKNPKIEDKRLEVVSNRIQQHFTEYVGVSFDESRCHGVPEGYRPYLIQEKNKPTKDFVNKHDNNLFSATGGAKSTIILCGYMANQILELVENV